MNPETTMYRAVITINGVERPMLLGSCKENANDCFGRLYLNYRDQGWVFDHNPFVHPLLWTGKNEWTGATMTIELIRPRRSTRDILAAMRREMDAIL